MTAKITHYACPEGSEWTELKGKDQVDVPTVERLDKLRMQAKRLGNQYCYIGQLTIHSFKTNDGRIWDTLNGWR